MDAAGTFLPGEQGGTPNWNWLTNNSASTMTVYIKVSVRDACRVANGKDYTVFLNRF